MTRYTIRYRCGDERGRLALIVDNDRGDAFLFSGGRLQARLAGRDADARLARLLEREAACTRVPEVDPYSLNDLRRLMAAAPLPAYRPALAGAG